MKNTLPNNAFASDRPAAEPRLQAAKRLSEEGRVLLPPIESKVCFPKVRGADLPFRKIESTPSGRSR